MRKLAGIQKIRSLKPIAGADMIVEAEVMGWHTVVKKEEFREGDLCVFFEVDAILPEASWSEFMRSRKFRVKTCKLRGVLSQGLALPLSILTPEQKARVAIAEGTDLTEILGIKKYEPPIPDLIGGHLEEGGPFPSWVPKTDEERIQSDLERLVRLQGQPFVITAKVDGTSMTVTHDQEGNLHVCSRNFAVKYNPENQSKHWVIAEKHRFADILKDTGLAIQGELVGPGLQKNRLRLTEPEILVFNVYDWKARKHLAHEEIRDFCKTHRLTMVPMEETGESFSYDLQTLLEKAKGVYQGTTNRREGIVVRARSAGHKLSFKVLNNEFLLQDEE